MRPLRALGAALTGGALTLAAACGGGSADRDTSAPARTVTVEAANGAVAIPATPRRIVSLSPTHTETLFAIGAGSQVVAVDDQSDHPAQAPRTKLSGFKPNAEAIIGYKPDLVVLSNDQDGIVAALQKVKVPVLVEPAATKLDEAYDQILDLGRATGRDADAKRVTDDMRNRIQQEVAAAKPPRSGRLSYYHELDQQFHTVTSKTFIGQLYGLFGLRNIADDADKQGSGYPQLSRESLLQDDPDLVFLADTQCCQQSPETVAKRPGWKDLKAVRNENVVALDDDVASRWGPRLPEFVKAIGGAVREASEGK
ncbi:ABC transporter substrate-binding protein [Actinomadura kijaniata]|uniref:Iron complex transport system substrate-binding protein n=1 Tax=Actinomadura namibiensis TaxID=182080 RepID=A0A7W3LV48_ACTNM|nr:ABC transporter substrate-binding protein [Actinomadura namibiensis]MBA8954846.1 iron complex transport system substrate-binding protein [Actinomadura namibiensis]